MKDKLSIPRSYLEMSGSISILRLLKMLREEVVSTTTHLSEAEVDARCFEVLGLLQSRKKKISSVEEPNNKPDTESITDRLLSLLDIPLEDLYVDNDRQDSVKDLLSYPQVRERLQSIVERELRLYKSSLPKLTKWREKLHGLKLVKRQLNQLYLKNKDSHGQINELVRRQINNLSRIKTQLEQELSEILLSSSEVERGFMEAIKLLEYKRQYESKGFVLTPSRVELIDKISNHILQGHKVFCVGSTGTGKTDLTFYVFDELLGGYEVLGWHENTTVRDIFGTTKLTTDIHGNVVSAMEEGPYASSLSTNRGMIHDEITAGKTRTIMALKYLLNRSKKGHNLHLPGFNGRVFEIGSNWGEIFTGNPLDNETTKDREEMDPAILRELTGLSVSYMPKEELRDIILAKLIEKTGVLRLSSGEVTLISNLCYASSMMQNLHDGTLSEEVLSKLGLSREDRLTKHFLDPGSLFRLFDGYGFSRAQDKSLSEHLSMVLEDFINDPKSNSKEEKKLLKKVLRLCGVYNSLDELILPERLSSKSYYLPSELSSINIQPLDDTNPLTGEVAVPEESPEEKESREGWQSINVPYKELENGNWIDKTLPNFRVKVEKREDKAIVHIHPEDRGKLLFPVERYEVELEDRDARSWNKLQEDFGAHNTVKADGAYGIRNGEDRVPTNQELSILYLLKTEIGWFKDDWYWSSSGYNGNNAWNQNFHTGIQGHSLKDDGTIYVRSLQSF